MKRKLKRKNWEMRGKMKKLYFVEYLSEVHNVAVSVQPDNCTVLQLDNAPTVALSSNIIGLHQAHTDKLRGHPNGILLLNILLGRITIECDFHCKQTSVPRLMHGTTITSIYFSPEEKVEERNGIGKHIKRGKVLFILQNDDPQFMCY